MSRSVIWKHNEPLFHAVINSDVNFVIFRTAYWLLYFDMLSVLCELNFINRKWLLCVANVYDSSAITKSDFISSIGNDNS